LKRFRFKELLVTSEGNFEKVRILRFEMDVSWFFSEMIRCTEKS